MAVVFFIAPEPVKDWEQDGLDAITLSYTMYPGRQTAPPRAQNGADSAAGPS
jgi:cytochrome c oxidase assembly protein subunit 11